jgi:hypothetical protein
MVGGCGVKIIRTDNYDRETRSDFLVAAGLNSVYATLIVDLLNTDPKRDDDAYYKAVYDDHVLYEFKP